MNPYKTDEEAWEAFRRVRILRVSMWSLSEMFRSMDGDHVLTLAGLPDDAVLGDVYYDFPRGAFMVKVFSKTFSPVPDGESIPWLKHGLDVRDLDVAICDRQVTGI